MAVHAHAQLIEHTVTVILPTRPGAVSVRPPKVQQKPATSSLGRSVYVSMQWLHGLGGQARWQAIVRGPAQVHPESSADGDFVPADQTAEPERTMPSMTRQNVVEYHQDE